MNISIADGLKSIREVAQGLPSPRGGSLPPSSLRRWICDGLKDANGELIFLPGIRMGGTWFTSREAVDMFVRGLNGDPAALAELPRQGPKSPAHLANCAGSLDGFRSRKRSPGAEAAAKRLEALGA